LATGVWLHWRCPPSPAQASAVQGLLSSQPAVQVPPWHDPQPPAMLQDFPSCDAGLVQPVTGSQVPGS
jgi:hypothetical protein